MRMLQCFLFAACGVAGGFGYELVSTQAFADPGSESLIRVERVIIIDDSGNPVAELSKDGLLLRTAEVDGFSTAIRPGEIELRAGEGNGRAHLEVRKRGQAQLALYASSKADSADARLSADRTRGATVSLRRQDGSHGVVLYTNVTENHDLTYVDVRDSTENRRVSMELQDSKPSIAIRDAKQRIVAELVEPDRE
jgi:hypothetical protein